MGISRRRNYAARHMIYERSLMPAASSRSESTIGWRTYMAFFFFKAEFGRGQVHSLTVEEK